jgi:hypothetical protein
MLKWGRAEEEARRALRARKDPRTPHRGVGYLDGVAGSYGVEVKYGKKHFRLPLEDWQRKKEVSLRQGRIPILVMRCGSQTLVAFDLAFFDLRDLLKASESAVKDQFRRYIGGEEV